MLPPLGEVVFSYENADRGKCPLALRMRPLSLTLFDSSPEVGAFRNPVGTGVPDCPFFVRERRTVFSYYFSCFFPLLFVGTGVLDCPFSFGKAEQFFLITFLGFFIEKRKVIKRKKNPWCRFPTLLRTNAAQISTGGIFLKFVKRILGIVGFVKRI